MAKSSCCCPPNRTLFESVEQPPVQIKETTSVIDFDNRLDHLLARIGWNRQGHLVEPGLYKIGAPTADSPVFVTANYTLSFDVLRSSLTGLNAYILVLDTKGVNVWCAAGKGTFGTDELIARIEQTRLPEIVKHRKLILPQLGAVGVAAHIVKKRSGFSVEYGPVRANDIPEFMRLGSATKEMRRVTFTLMERLAVVPVEFKNYFMPLLGFTLVMYLANGVLAAVATLSAFLAGIVIFPMLLPSLPMANFSLKGFLLGITVAALFSLLEITAGNTDLVQKTGWAIFYILALPPITSYLALNFTGSTTFTSVSGVKTEIAEYTPVMIKSFGAGMALMTALVLLKWVV